MSQPPKPQHANVRPDCVGEICRREVDPDNGFDSAFQAVADDWL